MPRSYLSRRNQNFRFMEKRSIRMSFPLKGPLILNSKWVPKTCKFEKNCVVNSSSQRGMEVMNTHWPHIRLLLIATKFFQNCSFPLLISQNMTIPQGKLHSDASFFPQNKNFDGNCWVGKGRSWWASPYTHIYLCV